MENKQHDPIRVPLGTIIFNHGLRSVALFSPVKDGQHVTMGVNPWKINNTIRYESH